LTGIGGLAITGCIPHLPPQRHEEQTTSSALPLPQMDMTWQNQMTLRPYAPDVDDSNQIWHGHNDLFCTDAEKATTRKIDSTALNGLPLSTTLCCNGKVYILCQLSPDIYVYDPVSEQFTTEALPDSQSNIWFGKRLPGNPQLYLYVRNRGHLTIWDTELNKGRMISYPDNTDLWSGHYNPAEQALYSFTLDSKPARIIRFDIKKQVFEQPIPCPDPGMEVTGVNPIGDTLWCADRFTGRLYPYNWVSRSWGEPVSVPGAGTDFAFIGIGCSYQNLALYSLSTYQGAMKYDFNTNEYLSTPNEDIGLDGLPHHFLNSYLVFHPESHRFAYLSAPSNDKRYPLICYSLVSGERLLITGFDIWSPEKGYPDMKREGELHLFSSQS